MRVWIIEQRVSTEYGWSEWRPTFDEDCGPYDTAARARKNMNSLATERTDFQFRVKAYVRQP